MSSPSSPVVKPIQWDGARLKHHFWSDLPARGAVLLLVERVTPAERGWVECGVKRPVEWLVASEEGNGLTMPQWVEKVQKALALGLVVAVHSEDIRERDGTPWPMSKWLPLVVRPNNENSQAEIPIHPVRVVPHWGHLQLDGPGNWITRSDMPHLPVKADIGWGSPLPSGTRALECRMALDRLAMHLAIAREKAGEIMSAPRLMLRKVREGFNAPCLFDKSGPNGRQTIGRALTAMLLIADKLKPLLKGQDMVGVWLPTSTASALVNGALGLLGKVSINLNYSAAETVSRACLDQTSAKLVISAKRFTARMPFDPGAGRTMVLLDELLAGTTSLQKLWALARARFAPLAWLEKSLGIHNQSSADLATLIFSSGSTGQPKGVELTWGNLVSNIQSLIHHADITPRDSILACLPFFHSFGYTITLWAPLTQGMRAAYHPDPRQGREIGEICREEQCTVFLSTATFLRFSLKRAEDRDFASLRFLVCGAEKLPVSLAEDFQRKFGVRPIEGYGCTELSPVSNLNLPDIPLPDGRTLVRDVPGSVGRMVTGCAARIEDPEHQRDIDWSSQGMVLIGGANVMRGYWGQPEKTRGVISEGYYRTGDIGFLDEQGHLTLTGRLSRFAKCGGEMVPLERLEELLHEVIATTERACAVSCVPDTSRGERVVVLFLKPAVDPLVPSVAEWIKKLSATGIPALWVPSAKDFFAVEEIPTLGSGKLDLQGLRAAALKITGTAE